MPEYFLVYPAYLGRSSSRSRGRRVPVSASSDELTLDEILAAARSLGFEAEAEPTKNYPRQFYTYAGRLKVKKKAGIPKGKFLRALGQELRRRAASAPRR
jgi:signal recognition particle subunit SRP19